jgi:hypothetical protein
MEAITYKCILHNLLQLEQDRKMICVVPTLHIQPYKCMLHNVLQLEQDREMCCFVPNPPHTNCHLSNLYGSILERHCENSFRTGIGVKN